MVTSNFITSVVEQAIQGKIEDALYNFGMPVYISDGENLKAEMPYVVVHADNYEEQIGPGTGIFKVQVTLKYRCHSKEESENFNASVIIQINNFAYSNAAIELNGLNLHVYGFIPGASGQMQANPEAKCYEYLTTWELICMPRPNS